MEGGSTVAKGTVELMGEAVVVVGVDDENSDGQIVVEGGMTLGSTVVLMGIVVVVDGSDVDPDEHVALGGGMT